MIMIIKTQYQSKVLLKTNYRYRESRGDKDKKLSVKQYLYKSMPYLSDLINQYKANESNTNGWKI